MRFSAHLTAAGQPEFRLRTEMGPLSFVARGQGTLQINTGRIELAIDAVPITIRVPFLPPSRRATAGSIGPFRVHIKPAEASVRATEVGVEGRIGTEEGGCAVEGTARGQVEVDLTGEIPGRLVKAAVEGAFDE